MELKVKTGILLTGRRLNKHRMAKNVFSVSHRTNISRCETNLTTRVSVVFSKIGIVGLSKVHSDISTVSEECHLNCDNLFGCHRCGDIPIEDKAFRAD